MNRAAEASGNVFSIMYNQRCNPLYKSFESSSRPASSAKSGG